MLQFDDISLTFNSIIIAISTAIKIADNIGFGAVFSRERANTWVCGFSVPMRLAPPWKITPVVWMPPLIP